MSDVAPTMLSAVFELARAQKTPAEIKAALPEINDKTLAVYISMARRSGIAVNDDADISVKVNLKTRAAIVDEAYHRNVSVEVLVSRLLNIVAQDDLFNAVLGKSKGRRQ